MRPAPHCQILLGRSEATHLTCGNNSSSNAIHIIATNVDVEMLLQKAHVTCLPSSQMCASHLPVLQSHAPDGTCAGVTDGMPRADVQMMRFSNNSTALMAYKCYICTCISNVVELQTDLQWCVTPLKRDEVPWRLETACLRLITPPLYNADN